MPKLSAPALALAAGALALAGCGSSSGGTTSSTATPTTPSATTASTAAAPAQAPSNKLTLAANPEGQLKYDKSTLTATAGKVSIDFTNMSPLMHNMTIESSSGQIVGATPTFQGGSKTLDVNLKAGVYKFFCSVPGHRMAGMEGTLTVK
jgi:plastocyanin